MILGLSTSGRYCGVALWADGDVIAALHEGIARGQAERLMPMIEEVLATVDARLGDLQAVGVGIGPGNFTGIRISISAARGLSLGLDIPCVGVSELEARALDAVGGTLVSMSAGRGHVFLQRFADGAGRGPELVALDMLADWAHPHMTCIGDHAEDVASATGARVGAPAFAPACGIARIAATRWQNNHTPPAPLYLRSADAAPARDVPVHIVP